MPLRRGNQRETASQKASDYSDAVIDFMDHHGYFLEGRAEDTGEFEDIVFVPKAGNRSPVVAEARYRTLDVQGLSPNDYVEGFAERFYQWEEGTYREYEFYLFTTNLANLSLWKDLFRRLKKETIESFYEKMKGATSGVYRDFLEQHDVSLFERFLENTVIYGDYTVEDLRRINERISETGEYNFDPYLLDYEPIREIGIHKTNLIEISELPTNLYKIPAHEDLTANRFYQHRPHDILPIYYHEDSLYSLLPSDEFDDVTIEMCSPDRATSISFEEFALESPTETEIDVSKVLLEGVVTTIADKVGAVVNKERGETRIFQKHADTDIKLDGKWLTRGLITGEARHRSVSVFMRYLNGQYYIGLYPTIEFTRDGERLVSSARKKSLMDSHNPAKHPQNRRKSTTVEMWVSKLSLKQSLALFDLPTNLQSVVVRRVDDLELEIRPPESPEERNHLIETTLGVEPGAEDDSLNEYL